MKPRPNLTDIIEFCEEGIRRQTHQSAGIKLVLRRLNLFKKELMDMEGKYLIQAQKVLDTVPLDSNQYDVLLACVLLCKNIIGGGVSVYASKKKEKETQ